MRYKDLIMVRNGQLLYFYVVHSSLSLKIVGGSDVRLFGALFRNRGACCEYLEVTEAHTDAPVGIQCVDFYGGDESEAKSGLCAENVTWTEDGGATVLFSSAQNIKTDARPYLPVLFLIARETCCYFIAEGVSIQNALSLNELIEDD